MCIVGGLMGAALGEDRIYKAMRDRVPESTFEKMRELIEKRPKDSKIRLVEQRASQNNEPAMV